MPENVLVNTLIVIVACVLAVGAMLIVLRRKKGSGEGQAESEPDLRIDVGALPDRRLPPRSAQLHFYNIPVRLAVLVIAPLGRDRPTPTNAQLAGIVEGLLPHMMKILEDHQPEFRRWPPQISWQGFAQAFFKNVRLPGHRGKGSPWCSIAGKFDVGGEMWLAGLTCCAEEQNSIGQVVIQSDGQWLDVLRVRTVE